jgi:hypothetical protein
MKFRDKIKTKFIPYRNIVIASALAYLKTFYKKPKIHFEKSYTGERILILALYEKGHLRPNIINLFNVAKKAGVYIIAVNTQRCVKPKNLQSIIDCYIERPNFGQDFGSYKTAYTHIYKRGWDKHCPRLLMLNDSIFYSKKNLEFFIHQMFHTTTEVLGATENHEKGYHLGSFCISLDNSILQHPNFKRFWSNYKKTKIRPEVIEKGEKKLTKTLHKCISSETQLTALFNLSWLIKYIEQHPDILNTITEYYTESNHLGWQPASLITATESLKNKYIYTSSSTKIDNIPCYFLDTPETTVAAIKAESKSFDVKNIETRLQQEIKNNLFNCFTVGSQIHQNAILLHHLGLPIVKLDIYYRGAMTTLDVEKITRQLDESQKDEFRQLIFLRPYGETALRGWKHSAFIHGWL